MNELRPMLRCTRRVQLPAAADVRSADLRITHTDGTLRIEVPKAWSTDTLKVIGAECDYPDSIVDMDIDMTGPTGNLDYM